MFIPGDKVKCLDRSGTEELVKGRIYTVLTFSQSPFTNIDGMVYLAELQGGENGFLARRFVKILLTEADRKKEYEKLFLPAV